MPDCALLVELQMESNLKLPAYCHCFSHLNYQGHINICLLPAYNLTNTYIIPSSQLIITSP